MKKIIILFISIIMILSLAACSEGQKSDSTENKKTSADIENAENESTFKEIVVIDNEECSIKITGIEHDPNNEKELSLSAELENKSVDKTFTFAVESASINGVVCDAPYTYDVSSGETQENCAVAFVGLEGNDIGDYTDIELTFCVAESGDENSNAVAKETVHIYPYGEDKVTSFVRKENSSDNVIINNDNVTVTVIGYENSSDYFTVKLYLENKSGKNVVFSAADASVNGLAVDPFFYEKSISAGKCTFYPMILSKDESIIDQDAKIVEFNFRAYDQDNESEGDIVNEVITLNP